MNEFEAVIGLEVHAELKTKTKIFCACPTAFGAEPNTQVCPVCLGFPGTLPALNKGAVEKCVAAGIALNCNIEKRSRFDRKNYFYPDLPKAYQISQYDLPLCHGGYLNIETDRGKKSVGITRIHLEEDAGKLIHKGESTLIDCNRCGVPLIEIVSEPHMSSADEVVAYLKKLRSILVYAGISDGKMNEGSLRCDVNLSVRRKGEPLGTRCELKNLNSFKFIEKAIEYEKVRQIEVILSGGEIVQETRRFDEEKKMTFSMRKKESQSDYRFFREPDLPAVVLTDADVERIKATIPALPDERKQSYIEKYSLSPSDAEVLILERETADYFESCAAFTKHPVSVANMITTEIMGIAKNGESIDRIPPESLGAVADMMGDETINSATAKKLIRDMWEKGIDPKETVEKEGLAQINDEEKVRGFVLSAIEKSEKAVKDYLGGKDTAQRSIVGKAMGESRGRANPALVAKIVSEELSKLK